MVDDMEANRSESIGGNSLDSVDSDLSNSQDLNPSDPWEAFFSDPSYGQPLDPPIQEERVETATDLRRRRKREGFYVFVTWSELERLGPVCTKADLLVWLHLRSLQSTKGAASWVWANLAVLLSWGVRERSYRRAIANLTEAGFAETDAQPGKKTRVRLKPMEPEHADEH
jgi:hypothetical protein